MPYPLAKIIGRGVELTCELVATTVQPSLSAQVADRPQSMGSPLQAPHRDRERPTDQSVNNLSG